MLSPLPHSWHSWHSFSDDAGPCTARACTGTCDFRVSFDGAVQRAECTRGERSPAIVASII